jgi:hypothetical protein
MSARLREPLSDKECGQETSNCDGGLHFPESFRRLYADDSECAENALLDVKLLGRKTLRMGAERLSGISAM